LLVAVLGNLGEIGVWMQALREISTVDAKSSIPYVTDLARVLSGLLRWITHQARPGIRPEWPYWNPSRIMTNGEINEFPFFTFLYADLHAHLIGLPFTLLALGLAVAVVLRKARPLWEGSLFWKTGGLEDGAGAWLEAVQSGLRRVDWGELLLLGVIGLVVGALRPINSWDYPTYLLIAFVALALRQFEQRRQIDIKGLWAVAWRTGWVLALSILLMQPFLSRFGTAYTSIERWKGPRTGLGAYLVIHGLFLFLIVSRLVVELFGKQSRRGVPRLLRLSLRHWDRLPRLFSLYGRLVHEGREFDLLGWAATAVLLLLLAWLVKAKQWFFILMILLILGTLWIVLQNRMEAKRRFLWLLFGMGLALSLGVDLVVLKGDIGRMNTVFKFYLQIWVLWSVVAVVSLSELAERLRGWPQQRRRWWQGILAGLVFLAVLYPIAATRAKIGDRFDASVGPTLDGMAYMQRAVYYDGEPIELKWDYEAINWLLDNVQGSPVIAEGNTEPRGLYRWGSRVAIYTGLPTMIGWSWHQRQQRSAMPDQWVSRRLDDVYRLYSDSSIEVAQELLKKYDVRYIYVGDVERIYYPASGLEKFEAMRAQGLLNLVYHNEKVRIYLVLRPAVAGEVVGGE
jgi:YYY domain-containing protein